MTDWRENLDTYTKVFLQAQEGENTIKFNDNGIGENEAVLFQVTLNGNTGNFICPADLLIELNKVECVTGMSATFKRAGSGLDVSYTEFKWEKDTQTALDEKAEHKKAEEKKAVEEAGKEDKATTEKADAEQEDSAKEDAEKE